MHIAFIFVCIIIVYISVFEPPLFGDELPTVELLRQPTFNVWRHWEECFSLSHERQYTSTLEIVGKAGLKYYSKQSSGATNEAHLQTLAESFHSYKYNHAHDKRMIYFFLTVMPKIPLMQVLHPAHITERCETGIFGSCFMVYINAVLLSCYEMRFAWISV